MAEENNNVILDQDVKNRLDKIDWNGLEANLGITREMIEKRPNIARQLVYQEVTDLVNGYNANLSGQFALRAVPGRDEKDLWTVKAFTIQQLSLDKNGMPKNDLYFMGARIYSESALKALFEQTTWQNDAGETVRGHANANAGTAIPIKIKGQEEPVKFLISMHQPTNQLFGVPVSAVESMLSNGSTMYGVTISEDQAKVLAQGGAVKLDGCQKKDGTVFSACVQFDAAKRKLVPVHPTWLKKAERAGVDTGLVRKREAAPAQETVKKAAAKKTQAPKKTSKSRLSH